MGKSQDLSLMTVGSNVPVIVMPADVNGQKVAPGHLWRQSGKPD